MAAGRRQGGVGVVSTHQARPVGQPAAARRLSELSGWHVIARRHNAADGECESFIRRVVDERTILRQSVLTVSLRMFAIRNLPVPPRLSCVLCASAPRLVVAAAAVTTATVVVCIHGNRIR